MNERQDAAVPPPDYGRTRRNLLVLVIGVTLLIVVVLQFGGYLAQRRVVVGEYDHLRTHIERSHRRDVQLTLDLYTARARNILARPEVIAAVRDHARPRLLSVMANAYSQLLAENAYLDVLHFHGPDNVPCCACTGRISTAMTWPRCDR